MKKRILCALMAIAAAGCVFLGGCTVKTEVSDDGVSDTQTSTDVENIEQSENAPDEKQPETPDDENKTDGQDTPDEPVKPVYINKLTGLETTEELSNIRPVAIMINNIRVATPQQGISAADIIYEVPAEGGITRLLCLFTDYATLPETGSVRSARDYYIDLSDAHDAIYVHSGTSPQADSVLAARKTDNMNGIYFSTPFYRNKWRYQNMGQEHSLMTTGELLVKGISEKGYRTESAADQPLTFAETENEAKGDSAKYASLKFSYYATTELEYDEESGVYMKSQYGGPHIDSNNDTQLSFENAVFLYCPQGIIKGDTAGRLYVNFYGDGEGYYMSNGAVRRIKWHKDSRTTPYVLYEEDGITELVLNPGKTYIGIASLGSETVFE